MELDIEIKNFITDTQSDMHPLSARITMHIIDPINHADPSKPYLFECVSCKEQSLCPKVFYSFRVKLDNNPTIEREFQLNPVCSKCVPKELDRIETGLIDAYELFKTSQ